MTDKDEKKKEEAKKKKESKESKEDKAAKEKAEFEAEVAAESPGPPPPYPDENGPPPCVVPDGPELVAPDDDHLAEDMYENPMEGDLVLAHTFKWSEMLDDGTWNCPRLKVPTAVLEAYARETVEANFGLRCRRFLQVRHLQFKRSHLACEHLALYCALLGLAKGDDLVAGVGGAAHVRAGQHGATEG